MMLEEMQARLKKAKIETQEQLWGISSLYILLDLSKDDFCGIVDKIGLEKLLEKRERYDSLFEAMDELKAKRAYLSAKEKLASLNEKLADLRGQEEELRQALDGYENRVMAELGMCEEG
jgi:phage-related tail protein